MTERQEHLQRFAIVPRQAVEDKDITDTIFRTLATIASYNDRDGWCFPSYQTIAERRGLSRRTVIRHIKTLVEKGYLHKIERSNENGEQTSNKYYTVLDYFPNGVTTAMSPPSDKASVTPPVTTAVSPKENHLTEPPKKGGEEKILEAFRKDTQDYISKSKAIPEDSRDWQGYPPDVIPYLKAFASQFRKPFKDEKSKWLKIARKWISRGYNVADVHNAAQHHLEKDLPTKGPESITYAFDAGSKKPNGRKRAAKVFGEAPEGWYDK